MLKKSSPHLTGISPRWLVTHWQGGRLGTALADQLAIGSADKDAGGVTAQRAAGQGHGNHRTT